MIISYSAEAASSGEKNLIDVAVLTGATGFTPMDSMKMDRRSFIPQKRPVNTSRFRDPPTSNTLLKDASKPSKSAAVGVP